TAPPPSSPPPSCYTPEPENALSESMQEKLAAWLHGRSRCTLYEVCLEVFGIPPEDLNRAGQTRLGCMLKSLGWVSQRETVASRAKIVNGYTMGLFCRGVYFDFTSASFGDFA
ncbi:hypothetical protein, partial [Thiorhodospira sibirica]|uniref:hypothetical protein n=1 Tax=Thiorhodospira sibirica TaxID=154347 RepID=UPI001C8F09CE